MVDCNFFQSGFCFSFFLRGKLALKLKLQPHNNEQLLTVVGLFSICTNLYRPNLHRFIHLHYFVRSTLLTWMQVALSGGILFLVFGVQSLLATAGESWSLLIWLIDPASQLRLTIPTISEQEELFHLHPTLLTVEAGVCID